MEPAARDDGRVRAAISEVAKRTLWPLTAPVGSVQAVRTSAPHVVLTFDDGPEPGSTEKVLSALGDHGATATFFVLVRRAERYPQLLHEVRAAGHEIALHGIDHRRLTGCPTADVNRGLEQGKKRLEDLTGVAVRWFRPPYGAQTPRIWRAIRASGLEPVLWGPAAWDWLDRPVHELTARALRGVRRGSVLLAHDGFADAEDGVDDGPRPRFDRGALARGVLAGLAERGLSGRALSAALVHGKASYRAWFRR